MSRSALLSVLLGNRAWSQLGTGTTKQRQLRAASIGAPSRNTCGGGARVGAAVRNRRNPH